MHVADHLTLDELRARADAEGDKRLFLRLRAVYLAATGMTAPDGRRGPRAVAAGRDEFQRKSAG